MWECKIVQFDEKISLEAIEDELNRLGRECWELVSFDGEIAVLKRRLKGVR
jgi:hypothetical protein